jgi:hypothetical protein
MTARNRKMADAAAADRADIEALLRARTQAEPLLKPKTILKLLGWPYSKFRTVQRQMAMIRATRIIADASRHLSFERSAVASGHAQLPQGLQMLLDNAKLDSILTGLESLNARLDAAERERAEHRKRIDALCQRADAVSAAYAGDPAREAEGLPPPFNPAPNIH